MNSSFKSKMQFFLMLVEEFKINGNLYEVKFLKVSKNVLKNVSHITIIIQWCVLSCVFFWEILHVMHMIFHKCIFDEVIETIIALAIRKSKEKKFYSLTQTLQSMWFFSKKKYIYANRERKLIMKFKTLFQLRLFYK